MPNREHERPLSRTAWKPRRSQFGGEAKKAIWERDEGHCVYCGDRAVAIDHIFPVARGGPSIKANGVLACRRCNGKKSANIPIDALTRAFYHLLTKGESLKWIDEALANS